MSNLKLKCRVVHVPGVWGASVPVVGAKVEITDVDAPGRGNDIILTTTTDTNGKFEGTSSEWQDTIKVRIPAPTFKNPFRTKEIEKPDITDVLMLNARIKYECPGSSPKETILPYTYINDNIESPPLVVPWGPCRGRLIAKINGNECNSYDEMANQLKGAIDRGENPIKIRVFGTDAEMLKILARPKDELARWLKDRLPSIPTSTANVLTGAEWVGIILALAALALAVGVSIAIVILACCALYAIEKGYHPIGANTGGRVGSSEFWFDLELGK